MKIAFMSGGYKNAGDFLIDHRCKQLLKKFIQKNWYGGGV